MTLEKWSAAVTIVGLPLLIASLLYAYKLDRTIGDQLFSLIKIAEQQNNIALNNMVFNDPTNIGIISAIDSGSPILISHGGKFTAAQLDKYLSDFDTVELVYNQKIDNERLLTEQQLCDSFSYYLQHAAQNKEIDSYIKNPNNGDYFPGFRDLQIIVTRSSNPNCH